MRVEVIADYKGDGKPTVFTFTYTLDKALLSLWLSQNLHLTEGPLSFVSKGIEIVIPYGLKKLDKSGFSIDNSEGGRDWLPLLDCPAYFKAHRDLFGGKEWECFYVDEL